MKKIVKSWGKSLGVYFTLDDIKIYKLKVGDVVQVDIDKPVDWSYIKRQVKKNEIQDKH